MVTHPSGDIIPPPTAPMAVARRLVQDMFTDNTTVTLRSWRGGFCAWDGRCWPDVEAATVRTRVYRYLEHARYLYETATVSEVRPWDPSRMRVTNVIDSLMAVTHLEPTVQPPAWVGVDGPDPRDLLVTANGVVHVPTRTLRPHDPRLFVRSSVPFAFDADAPAPARWFAFIEDLFSSDPDSADLLQELFGYLVSGDTSLQKIGLLVGPSRAGKGVIGRVLTGLLGREAIGAPTLAGLTTHFGLQDLIGKSLAIVSDARLSPKANVQALAERLLSISGEDSITIDRKYKEPWTGQLGTRILILSNELPWFTDASGALAKRLVVLLLTRSFYGKEDLGLTNALLGELSSILNWSLDGLARLRARGYFSEPASALDAARELEDLASPVSAFLRDACVVDRQQRVPIDDLWAAWKTWSADQAQAHGSMQTFSRDVRSAVPGLRVERPRGGQRRRVYVGVGLVRQP